MVVWILSYATLRGNWLTETCLVCIWDMAFAPEDLKLNMGTVDWLSTRSDE